MTSLPLDILIIGAGPTGLTAAIEAARHGLSVRIVDSNQARSPHSKALVAHARTLEIFRDQGVIEPVLASGQIFTAMNIYNQKRRMARIAFADLDWKDALYPFWLSIPQSETERCLEERLADLGVHVERQTALCEIDQLPESVRVTLSHADGHPESVEAAWVIGCDGARSTTRKIVNIGFEGHADDQLFILADVTVETELAADEGYNVMSADGVALIVPLPEADARRLIFHMPRLSADDKPEITLEMLQSLLDSRTRLGVKLTAMGWTSHFTIKHFVAAQHRLGRVFLAGDAAHIHSPVGGQGMNSGIQDAYNLIWKLALVHRGQSSPALLDSYETERHQVAENLIKRVSMATRVITTHNRVAQSIRSGLGSILIHADIVRNQLGRNVAMLDIHYASSPVIRDETAPDGLIQKVMRRVQKERSTPRAGYRAPNVELSDHEDLYGRFYGTHHTLLIFMGTEQPAAIETLETLADDIRSRYHGLIRPLIIASKSHQAGESSAELVLDADGGVHRAYGVRQPALVLIRPDMVIAYRSQVLDLDAFRQFLDGIMI